MTSLLIAWVAFPLVLALLSLGCGLLLESATVALPAALVLPAGFALIVVAVELATVTSATAPFATPLVVALAVAGLTLRVPWRRARIDVYAVAAAAAIFAVYAAPVVLSGEATFAGYIKLDDTATWLGLLDRVLEHGRSLDGLAPSSYFAVLHDDLPQGYPLGSFLALGVGRVLLGQEPAWLFQPYLAFLASLLGLALYALAAPLLRARPLRAVAAFIAAQSALLYGYALWGGVKELAAAALLATAACLLGPLLRGPGDLRAAVPLAVTSAALLGALSLGGIVWLLPLVLPGLVVLAAVRGWRSTLRRAIAYGGCATVLAIPVVASGLSFIGQAAGPSDLTRKGVLGNLFRPLSTFQLFGIWPAGDFRVSPSRPEARHVLIAAVLVAALVGAFVAWRRRSSELLVYAAGLTVGALLLVAVASPWVSAKALATACPAPLLLGIAGAGAVFESGRRIAALVLAGAIAGGVLWSNVLAYHDVTLAPRAQLAELAKVGERFKGQGPTLLNEYSAYGVRHFLRDMDAEGPSERRVRPIPLRSGQLLPPGEYADLDDFQLDAVLVYRTLVLRRSPTAARPPSVYRLVWAGRHYEVWQRPDSPPAIVEHLPLGGRYEPAAVPSCSEVERLAALAGAGGMLAAVPRPLVTKVELSPVPYPAELQRDGEDRRVVYLRRRSTFEVEMRVPSTARYRVWLGGSFLGRLSLAVDGRPLATGRHELNWPGQYRPMGEIALARGLHRLAVAYGGPDLHPGSGGNPPFGAGPIVLSRVGTSLAVTYVPPARARSLCGKRLDWIEALRS